MEIPHPQTDGTFVHEIKWVFLLFLGDWTRVGRLRFDPSGFQECDWPCYCLVDEFDRQFCQASLGFFVFHWVGGDLCEIRISWTELDFSTLNKSYLIRKSLHHWTSLNLFFYRLCCLGILCGDIHRIINPGILLTR